MPAGFALRFALETAFLVLLGVGAGIADLRTPVIVAVVAGGWALVCLIEVAVWRAQARPLPLLASLPASPAAAAREDDADGADPEPAPEPAAEEAEPEEGYPLRSDADFAPSKEAEDYTRVLRSETPAADGGQEAQPAPVAGESGAGRSNPSE